MKVDIDKIRELMEAMASNEIGHLKIKNGDDVLVLKRQGATTVVAQAPAIAPMHLGPATLAPPAPAVQSSAAEEKVLEGEVITSPFVGTFYRAPNPDAAPFISAGDSFSQGQSLCIIEAMKLMNEIEAEFSGKCLEVLVENGKPVEYGDPLFRVEKS